ncbi:MAG: hypothetical protein H6746_19715 [Deltaproteobacteria bacterium]|nr:hypothetical protein [Deltaproteobacteria bacterium]
MEKTNLRIWILGAALALFAGCGSAGDGSPLNAGLDVWDASDLSGDSPDAGPSPDTLTLALAPGAQLGLGSVQATSPRFRMESTLGAGVGAATAAESPRFLTPTPLP